MTTLTIRTDKPEAELGLYDGEQQLAYITWLAHRQLAETMHQKIADILAAHSKKFEDITGIVCFQGPGSFTGLRIGITVANALAMGLAIPVVATQEPDWIKAGIQKLMGQSNEYPILPHYGADVHITTQKK